LLRGQEFLNFSEKEVIKKIREKQEFHPGSLSYQREVLYTKIFKNRAETKRKIGE